MGHEVLRTFAHPSEIADPQLVGVCEGGGEGQPGGVAKRLCSVGHRACRSRRGASAAESFGLGEVETQEVACVVGHRRNVPTPQRLLIRSGEKSYQARITEQVFS